jgi:hypothetical protein
MAAGPITTAVLLLDTASTTMSRMATNMAGVALDIEWDRQDVAIMMTIIMITIVEGLVTMARPAYRSTTMRGHPSNMPTVLPHRHAQPRQFLRARGAGAADILEADARASKLPEADGPPGNFHSIELSPRLSSVV